MSGCLEPMLPLITVNPTLFQKSYNTSTCSQQNSRDKGRKVELGDFAIRISETFIRSENKQLKNAQTKFSLTQSIKEKGAKRAPKQC